jgi:hypothetical protein
MQCDRGGEEWSGSVERAQNRILVMRRRSTRPRTEERRGQEWGACVRVNERDDRRGWEQIVSRRHEEINSWLCEAVRARIAVSMHLLPRVLICDAACTIVVLIDDLRTGDECRDHGRHDSDDRRRRSRRILDEYGRARTVAVVDIGDVSIRRTARRRV